MARGFRLWAAFSLGPLVAVFGCTTTDAATSRTSKKRSVTTVARKPTTRAPKPTTVAATTTLRPVAAVLSLSLRGQTAPGWSVWTSAGAPRTTGGAIDVDIEDGGFVSVSRADDISVEAAESLRVIMIPGPTRWTAELSNADGVLFGRVPLTFGGADSRSVATATVPMQRLNPKGVSFSRVYLFATGSAVSSSVHEIALVSNGAAKSPTTAVSTPPAPPVIPPSLVAPTTSASVSGATGPQLPPIGRAGSPGVGSALLARPGPAVCGRVGPWRIMPLGDSLTGGSADVDGYGDSYRRSLWQLLRSRGFKDIDFVGNLKGDDGTYDGDHSGWGGYTTGPNNGGSANLYAHIANFVPQQFTLNESSGKDWVTFADPDIVLLNIGTNDGEGDPATVDRRLTGLVDVITKRAPTARIIVSSLPPSGGNFAIVGHVGVAAQKLALTSGGRVFYADVRTRMMLGDAELGAAPFEVGDWHGNGDSVHMAPSGGRKFALAWLPAVEAALKASRCA